MRSNRIIFSNIHNKAFIETPIIDDQTGTQYGASIYYNNNRDNIHFVMTIGMLKLSTTLHISGGSGIHHWR